MEEVTIMILDDQKFKKTSDNSKGEAFVATSNHSRSNLYRNN